MGKKPGPGLRQEWIVLLRPKGLVPALALAFLVHVQAPALDVRKQELAPLGPGETLASREFFRPDLSVTLGNELAPLPPALAAVAGPQAQLYVDPRSGAATNLVAAIPMIPGAGAGNAVSLESVSLALGRPIASVDTAVVGELVRRFAVVNAAALRIDPAQVGPARTEQVTPELWHVTMPQVVRGIPVRYGHVAAALSHGNMVLFGTETWGNVSVDTRPTIGAEQAVEAGFAYAGGRTAGDLLWSPAHLEIIPIAPGGDDGPYGHLLAWVFGFRREGEIESWEVLVDARSGDVVSFEDTNQYDARKVAGGAYPLTNTGICPANTTCGALQSGEPMPYADTGLAAPNNFTDASGVYEYSGGTATTTLNGRFVRMTDTCGPISIGSADGNIDLAGVNGQHDCTSGGGSAGNTAATRSGYYEINKLVEAAKGWLPSNAWLNQKMTSNMNIVDVCNAFYSPSDGSINFFRSGGGCRNTGEIAAVFDHEWGHALDDNDSGGQLSSSSEAYGDITGIYRLRSSCVGYGFFQTANRGCGMTADGTGFNQNESLTGQYCDTNCSGVRDADWAGHVANVPGTALGFVCAHCSAGSGPCGRQVHCSAAPSRQAAWDLVARDLQAAPFNMSREDAFNLGSKIFFQGSGIIGSWHGCTCGASSNGCGATNAYMTWIAADDDDGNLNNGTPHMTAIFNAFNRHGIACSTPAAVNGGCAGGPTTAPAVTATSTVSNQISVSWTAVAGAARYRVLRTEGFAGCDFGKAVVFEGNTLAYTDNDVADDRTYSYVVQPVGVSGACTGPGSVCTQATPVSCAGRLSSDRSVYGCGDVVQLKVTDADLKNAGPQTVAVSSTVETTPELVTLVESPAGSGVFRGSIPTSAAPSAGAGVLKVANGSTATMSFVDASACGTPDVPLQRTATIDCTGQPCTGAIALNKTTFNCSESVQITLVDSDLAGAGSRTVDVTSTVETAPEVVSLLESPAGSGTFVGTIATSSAAPAPNGVLNVAQGSTMTVKYLDASACGVANTLIQKTAPIDCTGQPCKGTLTTDRTVYTCSDAVQVTLVDSDLAGAGSKSIAVSSTQEAAPESLLLSESPAGSGAFVGSIPTTALPAAADGKISGADGSIVTFTYQDASACGLLNATAQRAVPLDCGPPVITNVRAEAITGSSADLKWDTHEPATTFVTYGTSKPPSTSSPVISTLVTAHSVHLAALPECGRIYYSVGSTDQLAQTSLANNGGQFFSFDVGTEVPTWFASPNVPVALPDSSPFPNVTPFTIDDPRTIVDVNVRLNISHNAVGQLIVSLRHPGGAQVFLSNHRGGGGDNFVATVFDDEAAAAIATGTAPFTGSYRPDSTLSVLDGKGAQGTWQLEVLDNVAGNVATITGFEIQITLGEPCAPPEILQLTWPSKTSLAWSADAAAATYTLHRGTSADLPSLLTAATDSCVRASTASTAVTGLSDAPPSGELQWFLVVGSNASGPGQAGFATGGPRLLDSAGSCP
jgi:subtilisin-like proprotein convertase family protein